MTMARYTKDVEFAYQLSTIINLTTMSLMYNLHISEAHKNTIVDCLIDVKMQDGSFIMEVPNLVCMLNLLETTENSANLIQTAETLSAIYLEVVGDRIDLQGCSNLLYGWTALGLTPELTDRLVEICIEKHNADSLYEEGFSSELVNIVRNLPAEYDEFGAILLAYITECFDDLNISWSKMVLLEVAQKYDKHTVSTFFKGIASSFHRKLQPSYLTSSKEKNIIAGSRLNRFNAIPDMGDYCDIWLALQLVAAKRISNEDAAAIKLIAMDLVKIFNGNIRW
jgi:hypothetical protein